MTPTDKKDGTSDADFRLPAEQLAWRCDPAVFDFTTTAELPSLDGTIGQDRALAAIDFGLGIRNGGFNLFILGEPGTGRSSTIKKILNSRAVAEPVPDDWCYVYDFSDDHQSLEIRLPAGTAKTLGKDVDQLVERLAMELPKVFEGKEYEQRKNQLGSEYQEKSRRLYEGLEKEAEQKDYLLQRSVNGLVLTPLRNGEPVLQQEFEGLSEDERNRIEAVGAELQERLTEVTREARELDKALRVATLAMERELLLMAVSRLFKELEEKYRDHAAVIAHFVASKNNIIERIDEFRQTETVKINLPLLEATRQEPSFERYRINLFVDNSEQQGAPVVYEANPTYFNVFGRIEHFLQMGNAVTNFRMIKAGALHRANGGYLILDCREVLLTPFTYEALKRAIRNREVKIEDMAEQYRLMATVSLKPQPIPLDCKIILIGRPVLYYLLHQLDVDFRKYFKVKADFDHLMENTTENVQQYALFVAAKCQQEKLTPFGPEGVARVIEHSARLTGDKEQLSSRFIDITDLIREAAYYAGQAAEPVVGRQHVEQAINAANYRSNKVEERIQRQIDDEVLMVATSGAVVGQINGLSVYLLGDYSFGRPARVTARTWLGKSGVVNIEREVKLSGPIHDKGLLILNGFFGERYAHDKPLTLAASICFEQSYGGIDGDSASTTELYALLSALSGVPIKQSIGVTGSVNQHGQVQAIGGVNEKVEGFFAVCQARGLSGEQGVIIPRANVRNLMLKEDVRAAVTAGEFHVWAIETVDEGIELLTGRPAGGRNQQGGWEEGSINALVDDRLRKMAETLRDFSQRNKDT